MHFEACKVPTSELHAWVLKRDVSENWLLMSLNDWSKVFDEKNQSNVVYLDFLKTFDQVPERNKCLKWKQWNSSNDYKLELASFLSVENMSG